jgi:hypothetical protein
MRAQARRSQRYHPLRAHWLRAAVALSRNIADVASRSVSPASAMMHALLCDARMRGCDDGQGRLLRYLSWFGGRVASML